MVKKDAGHARTAKRQRWCEADARAMLAAWRQSGKGLAEFARERGVHGRRLARWAARLEPVQGKGKVVQFHPVRLVSASRVGAQSSEKLEVVLGNGRAVRVPYDFAPEHLQRLLRVLEAET